MSTTSPSKPSSSLDLEAQAKLVHNVALGALIVCPIIALLPPRKLDTYTFMLLFGTGFGANQLTREYTGHSIIQHATMRMRRTFDRGSELPDKARLTQERLRLEKAERSRKFEESLKGEQYGNEPASGSKILAALTGRETAEKEEEKDTSSLANKIWLGGEGENWKAKRDRREKEALAQGKGYGDLITEQIWEVWNWGKDKSKEIKEKDEEVIAEKKDDKK